MNLRSERYLFTIYLKKIVAFCKQIRHIVCILLSMNHFSSIVMKSKKCFFGIKKRKKKVISAFEIARILRSVSKRFVS